MFKEDIGMPMRWDYGNNSDKKLSDRERIDPAKSFSIWVEAVLGKTAQTSGRDISLHRKEKRKQKIINNRGRSEIWADQSETAFKLHQFPCGYSCSHWSTETLRKWRNTRDWHKESKQRKMLSLCNEYGHHDPPRAGHGTILYCLHPVLLLPF